MALGVRAVLAVALMSALSGCALELLTATAVQSELQAQNATAAMEQLEQTRAKADEIRVRQAIDVYRAERGTYPPSLQALVPMYLDAVPVGPAGAPRFAYDPETGWFGDASTSQSARRGQTPARAQSRAPISSASPVAEQVQAIGIMNELNAQPSPTAGRARQQAEDLRTQQNERYEQIMDQLDL